MNFKRAFVSFPGFSDHNSSLYQSLFAESFKEKCRKHCECMHIRHALFASHS